MRVARLPQSLKRDGFTLIEILVVIAIIALLAGLSFVGLRAARNFSGNAVTRQRLDDIGQCVEMYKQKYGEYPPDCSASDDEIRRHILKRWPNALKSKNPTIVTMVQEARKEMEKGKASGGDTALLFWLAGPEQAGAYDGFYSDDRNPLGIGLSADEAINDPRETPMIELTFDSDGTGGGNYNDRGLMYKDSPIVYFRANSKDGYMGKELFIDVGNVAAPYMKNGTWYNPDSFQLIYAGEDGQFGTDPHGGIDHPEGEGDEIEEYEPRDLGRSDVSQKDRDNVTNFTNGATLDSEIEN